MLFVVLILWKMDDRMFVYVLSAVDEETVGWRGVYSARLMFVFDRHHIANMTWGPLVDHFRSHTCRNLIKGLP